MSILDQYSAHRKKAQGLNEYSAYRQSIDYNKPVNQPVKAPDTWASIAFNPEVITVSRDELDSELSRLNKQKQADIKRLNDEQRIASMGGDLSRVAEVSKQRAQITAQQFDPAETKKTLYANKAMQAIAKNPLDENAWDIMIGNTSDARTFKNFQTNPQYRAAVKASVVPQINFDVQSEFETKRAGKSVGGVVASSLVGWLRSDLGNKSYQGYMIADFMKGILEKADDTRGLTEPEISFLRTLDTYQRRAVNDGNTKMQEAAQIRQEAIGDSFAKQWLYDLVGVVPDMLTVIGTAFVTGGASMALGKYATTKAAEKLAGKALVKAMFSKGARKQAMSTLAKKLVVSPDTLPLGVKIFAQDFMDNLNEGMESDEAYFNAFVNAYGQSLLEGGGANKAAREGGIKGLKEFIKSAFGESFEEITQNWWEGAVDKLVAGKDMTWLPNQEGKESVVNPAEDLYAASLGFGAGFAGGSVVAAKSAKEIIDGKTKPVKPDVKAYAGDMIKYEADMAKYEEDMVKYEHDVELYEAQVAENEKNTKLDQNTAQPAPKLDPQTQHYTPGELKQAFYRNANVLVGIERKAIKDGVKEEGVDMKMWEDAENKAGAVTKDSLLRDILAGNASPETMAAIKEIAFNSRPEPAPETAPKNPFDVEIETVKPVDPEKPSEPVKPIEPVKPKVDTSNMSPRVLARMEKDYASVDAERVLDLISEGKTKAEIADLLDVKPRVVNAVLQLEGVPTSKVDLAVWSATRDYGKQRKAETTAEKQDRQMNTVPELEKIGARPVLELEPGEEYVANLGKRLGANVVFFEAGKPHVRGFVKDGSTIFMSREHAAKPDVALNILGHEFLHTIRTNNEEVFNILKEVVADSLTTDKISKILGQYSVDKDYQARLANDQDLLVEELMAEEAGNLFTDKKFWESVNAKDPSVARRLASLLREFINRVLGKAKDSPNIGVFTEAQIKEFRSKFEDIVAQTIQSPAPKPTPSQAAVRRSIERSDNFKNWFGQSVVRDENGKPKVVYSGHGNVATYGTAYKPKAGTAGAFYATDEPAIASSYANGKIGNMETYANGAEYRIKHENSGNYTKRLHDIRLTAEQAEIAEEIMSEVSGSMGEYIAGNERYDSQVRRWKVRGGARDLQSIFEYCESMGDTIAYNQRPVDAALENGLITKADQDLMYEYGQQLKELNRQYFAVKDKLKADPGSEKLKADLESIQDKLSDIGGKNTELQDKARPPLFIVQGKSTFEEIMDAVGLEWNSQLKAQPGVLPVYLAIENPIDTSQPFPEELMTALEIAAKTDRSNGEKWTRTYSLKKWVQDIKDGDEFWATQIPTKGLKIMKEFGYDGIVDRGGKTSGSGHNIYMAFYPSQIKSATGNNGQFNAAKNDMRYSVELPNFYSKLKELVNTKMGKTMPGDQLISMLKKNGVKQAELDHYNLEELVEGQKVDKRTLLAYLAMADPQIRELHLGEWGMPEVSEDKKRENEDRVREKIAELADEIIIIYDDILSDKEAAPDLAKRVKKERKLIDTGTLADARMALGSIVSLSSFGWDEELYSVTDEIALLGARDHGIDVDSIIADTRQKTIALMDKMLAINPNGGAVEAAERFKESIAKRSNVSWITSRPVHLAKYVAEGSQELYDRIDEEVLLNNSLYETASNDLVYRTYETPIYEQYVEKGDVNKYREIVFESHLDDTDLYTVSDNGRHIYNSDTGEAYELPGTNELLEFDNREDAQKFADSINSIRRRPRSWDDPHWYKTDTFQPFAHTRLNDRVAHDGGKVLFIEEIQSDVINRLKQRGVKTKETAAEADRLRTLFYKAKAEQRIVYDKRGDLTAERRLSPKHKDSWYQAEIDELIDRLEVLGYRLGNIELAVKYYENRLNDSPLVHNYQELVLKRIMQIASDEGYDYLSWTTGEQQARRWSLSQYVEKLRFEESVQPEPFNDHGLYKEFEVESKNEPVIGVLMGYQGGREVFDKPVTPSRLEEMIGKEVAEKLLQSKVSDRVYELEGDQMEVGGAGKGAFYDTIIPSAIKKITKESPAAIIINENLKGTNHTLEELIDIVNESKGQGVGNASIQPAIPISEKAKARIQQPQTLFSLDLKNQRRRDVGKMQMYGQLLDKKYAQLTEKRLDDLFTTFAARGVDNYSKAFIGYMSPRDFIDLTTDGIGYQRIKSETTPLDVEAIQNETQPIFLEFATQEDGDLRITGHEGRHRMMALYNAGIENVPVVLKQGYREGKYDKEPMHNIWLRGQKFSDTRGSKGLVKQNWMLPISYGNRAEIEELFLEQPERKPDVKFSVDTHININMDEKAVEKGEGLFHYLYRRTVDRNLPVGEANKRAGKLAANAAIVSGTVEQNLMHNLVDRDGNKIGKSWQDVVKPFGENEDFWQYMAHRHNIDRAREGKPVKTGVSSEQSAKYVENAEAKHPEYSKWGDSVTAWIDQFMQAWAVDTGLIDAEKYLDWREMYPSYFPTYREFDELEKEGNFGPGRKFVDLPGVSKKATGSSRDLSNPVGNVMIMVNKIVRTARYNEVGQALLESVKADPEKAAKYAELLDPGYAMFNSRKLDNVVTIWENGQMQYLQINDKLLLDSLKGLPKIINNAKAVRKVTGVYKGLITQYNPLFALRNIFRDIPTAYVYGSEHNPIMFGANLIRAGYQYTTGTGGAARYKALGGAGTGIMAADEAAQYAKLLQPSATKKLALPLKAIEFFNNLTEQAPRIAEFNKVYGKTGDVHEALYAAQNVTVNFSRGGDITKMTEPFVPYLNASVQGIDRFFDAFNFKKDPKGALLRMVKAGIAVTTPQVVSYVLCMADDEDKYRQLSKRTKDAYYVFPMPGESYFKVPKSRELGVLFGSLMERSLARDFDGFSGTVATNFLPVDMFTNNLFSPWVYNLPMNEDFAGRTIVPRSLEGYSPRNQYDDNTSEIAKFIGDTFNWSPKKIDYVVGAYSGVIGQFLIPATTKRSGAANTLERMTIGAFQADPAFSSQVTQDFYERLDEMERYKNDYNRDNSVPTDRVTDGEKMYSRMVNVSSLASKAYKYMNTLKSDDPKIREIRLVLNEYMAKALQAKIPADLTQIKNRFSVALKNLGVR